MKNKLLASILTACMLLTMLPTAPHLRQKQKRSPARSRPLRARRTPGTSPTGEGMMRGDLITIEAVKLPMFPAVKSWKLR